MSKHFTGGFGAVVAASCAFAATLLAPAVVHAAITIDHGDPTGGISCSDVATVDTTCLLPIGEPLTQDGAVSQIAVGEDNALLLVARPIAGSPGKFQVIEPPKSPSVWKVRAGTKVIDTAIPVRAGDQLVLVDPLVTTTSSSIDLDAPTSPNELETGVEVGVRALGRITIEPDGDRDGSGDETTDLCPGVARRNCAPAALVVGLTGPAYVPSQSPVAWTWTATNVGDTPQPFVVNVYSGEASPSVAGPPGSVCTAGAATAAVDAFVPAAQRSPLTAAFPLSAGQGTHAHRRDGALPDAGWSQCRLPVLAPGEATGGTIGGTGGMGSYYGLAISGLPAIVDQASLAKSTLFAQSVVIHGTPGKNRAAWRPTAITPGSISNRGVMPVAATCSGPPQAASCTATGVVKAPIGGAVLGTVRIPVASKPGATLNATVNFSSKGLRWLATHPKSRIDVSITTSWPGETAETTTVRVKPLPTKALKKKLAAMVKPKKKPKKKR